MTKEEILHAVRAAASPAELLETAKKNGQPITLEEATSLFSRYHATDELSDDELDNVAGGGACFGEPCPNCGTKNDMASNKRLGIWDGTEHWEQQYVCSNCGNKWTKEVEYKGNPHG